MKSKAIRNALLALCCTIPLSACSTFNLVRWGTNESTIYNEPDGGFADGILKPSVTVIGFPVAVVWDVVTFPFQILFGTYPYGDNFMAPGQVEGL